MHRITIPFRVSRNSQDAGTVTISAGDDVVCNISYTSEDGPGIAVLMAEYSHGRRFNGHLVASNANAGMGTIQFVTEAEPDNLAIVVSGTGGAHIEWRKESVAQSLDGWGSLLLTYDKRLAFLERRYGLGMNMANVSMFFPK